MAKKQKVKKVEKVPLLRVFSTQAGEMASWFRTGKKTSKDIPNVYYSHKEIQPLLKSVRCFETAVVSVEMFKLYLDTQEQIITEYTARIEMMSWFQKWTLTPLVETYKSKIREAYIIQTIYNQALVELQQQLLNLGHEMRDHQNNL